MKYETIKGEACELCGGGVKSKTDEPGQFYDGEDVKCFGICAKVVGSVFVDNNKALVVYDE